MPPPGNASVAFFDRQFRRQIDAADHALNPFEVEAPGSTCKRFETRIFRARQSELNQAPRITP